MINQGGVFIRVASIITGTMSRSVTVSSVTIWAPTGFFWISGFGVDDLLCFSLSWSWKDTENLGAPCSNGWWWAVHSATLHFFLLKQSRDMCPLLKQRMQQLCCFMTYTLSSKEDDVKVGHDASRWSPLHKRQIKVLFWLVLLLWFVAVDAEPAGFLAMQNGKNKKKFRMFICPFFIHAHW